MLVAYDGFETLQVSLNRQTKLGFVQLHRPKQSNAMTLQMAGELPEAVNKLGACEDVAVILLTGAGKNFCSGLDLSTMRSITADLFGEEMACPAQTRLRFLQEACSCLEHCTKPVVAAVHGACVGAGMDLICAADIRLSAPCANFCVKEVDLAIAADLGTLQRLPRIIGGGRARHMALTACTIDAQQAEQWGLVTELAPSRDALQESALKFASNLARKPRLASQGTKHSLLRAPDRSVQEGLDDVALWNASMLWSKELQSVLESLKPRSRL